MTAVSGLRRDELLSRSDRSRVFRRFVPGGSVICKEALGSGAADRTRHEIAMLERLSMVPGVAKLSAATLGNQTGLNSLCLRDDLGEPLAAVLGRERLDVATLLAVARQLAETLATVHSLRIVHRDINPSNILLAGAERRAVLIDFHIASSFAEERPAFTAQAAIAGTLAYIAPEQTGRTGRAVDHRADLYALGATLYEMAVGHTPFDGGDSFQLIRDHLVRVAASPAALDPSLPQALSDIIMRLLEKEPDHRYQSAEGLANDLKRLGERRAAGQSGPFPLGLHDFPKRLLPPSRLIGREAETATLAAAFADAVAGRRNGLLVAGVPGVGKTALVDELRPMVTAKRGWFVSGKFDQFHNDVENDAVSRSFRRLLNLLLAEPEEELAPIRTRLLEALGRNAGLAASLLPELALLLGTTPEAALADSVNAQARLTQIGIEILTCIASSERPVVFILDDLQWASATPLGFFDAMLAEKTSGLLLVGIYRATEVDSAHPLSALLSRWERFAAAPRTLLLENLRADGLGALLAGMLRIEPERAAELATAVGSRTEGNPYDTVELINALRHDGALVAGADGWTWDATTIRRYVGHGNVVDLLTTRIDALPPETGTLLEIVACLGGDVPADVLQAAAQHGVVELEAYLTPALDDGLIVLDHAAGQAVRFRHDRVQQAAYGRLDASTRLEMHRTIARRLACVSAYHGLAAEQYFAALDGIRDAQEGVAVVALFRNAAVRAAMLANYAACERYLAAALQLLDFIPSGRGALATALENELHTALYNLGRLEQADTLYAAIAHRAGAALDSVDSTSIQINSLTNRNMPGEALALGLGLLERLGFVPPERAHIARANAERLQSLERWCDEDASPDGDIERAEATDPVALGAAKLLDRMMPPAFFCDHDILNWLVLEGVRLWSEHGPQAALVGPLSHISNVTIAIRGDYRGAYMAARRILTVSEARGYEPETSQSRFLFALGAEHWFEPSEDAVLSAHAAHVGLLRGGDLQNACFTYFASIALLVECSQTVEELTQEVEAGLTSGIRTGNGHAEHVFLPFRQLAKALRGETAGASFTGDSFDEGRHLASLGQNPTAAVYFHITRALASLVFGATPDLVSNANAALALLQHIETTPLTALAHELHAVAAAARYRGASADERPATLEALEASRAWLQRRADDTPGNFLHAVRLIEAERDWAVGDIARASDAFEAALREARFLRSPRHRALISERAGLFNLERGLERYGLLLLGDARQFYQAWGATAKAAQLAARFPSLTVNAAGPAGSAMFTTISSETIDMVGILRASQALSSQTTLESLKASVVELLAALTGATSVLLVVRGDDTGDWFFSRSQSAGTAPVAVKEAGALGLLPLTVFRYVERTREPLLLTDAMRDDRFARDPYFARYEQCSMLVVPILSQGVPRAVLLLENRLGRAAFSTDRLDAVMLIAGQLTVSLDNALLYASLERKVAERTEALAAANEQLALLSRTDPLTGLVNRRGFDERLAAEWFRAQRCGTSIGLAMIDIDHFKSYNDHFGHPAGDKCLKQVADTLRSTLRPGSDIAARYGGEEFIVLLPGADIEGTYAAAERLRVAVAALSERRVMPESRIVTVSIGVVAFVPTQDDCATRYLELADVALYNAKRNGRNRVTRAEPQIAIA